MLRVGTVLRGIYRIDKYLSSGGFGNTYMATDIFMKEQVAIKEFFMKGITQRDEDQTTVSISNAENNSCFLEQKEKFKKEANRLHQLSNPHIVHVHLLFEENATVYYVMDYIDGESLSERMKRTGKPMTETEVRQILPQILDALETVHEKGFCHLDLKPSNILLDKSGQAILIDFGSSKQIGNDGSLATNAPTAFTHTPGYASRELIERNAKHIGPWTDLYALGATLYNLLTQNHPPLPSIIDDDMSEDKHVALPMPSDVSDSMRQLILWLMKTDRKQRPKSVDDLTVLLSSLLQKQSTVMKGESDGVFDSNKANKDSEETIPDVPKTNDVNDSGTNGEETIIEGNPEKEEGETVIFNLHEEGPKSTGKTPDYGNGKKIVIKKRSNGALVACLVIVTIGLLGLGICLGVLIFFLDYEDTSSQVVTEQSLEASQTSDCDIYANTSPKTKIEAQMNASCEAPTEQIVDDNQQEQLSSELSKDIQPISLSHLSTYNIVVSTMAIFENAQAKCRSLREQGYSSQIYDDELSGFYRVIIVSTDDEQIAVEKFKEFQKTYPAASILHVENGEAEFLTKTPF